MIKETKEGERVSSDAFPLYSWSKGWLYYRIERNFFNGSREVICKIWKWKDGANKMVMAMTKALHDNKDEMGKYR